jgi:hypothetical protein
LIVRLVLTRWSDHAGEGRRQQTTIHYHRYCEWRGYKISPPLMRARERDEKERERERRERDERDREMRERHRERTRERERRERKTRREK